MALTKIIRKFQEKLEAQLELIEVSKENALTFEANNGDTIVRDEKDVEKFEDIMRKFEELVVEIEAEHFDEDEYIEPV